MAKRFQPEYIPYSQTGNFAKIVLDYIGGKDDLDRFYTHKVNLDGIKTSIAQRKTFNTDREVLVEQLRAQYHDFDDCDNIDTNINLLLEENTFTVCTAHQPNVFTGHLYFLYKILHTIKLVEELKKQLPENNFVPVFFMGSEDADLGELNHVVIDGKKYKWETNQKGAVGRMRVDDYLIKLVDEISGRVSVEKYGSEIIETIKKCFKKNTTIERATFLLVHELFKNFGLIVLLPDNAAFKNATKSVFEDDLFNNTPSNIVIKTSGKLSQKYKVQAQPREINLFYLKGDVRNRIVALNNRFVIYDTDIVFTPDELKNELDQNPENFSPNVILRGLYQEMILPNIAFVGGGGELAYWLQLKDLFEHYQVPYPVLILRNSFLLIEGKYEKLMEKLDLDAGDLFKGEKKALDKIVRKQSEHSLQLSDQRSRLENVYAEIKEIVGQIDVTLLQHTGALEASALKSLSTLEKKMLRAEKRKFEDAKNQLSKIFNALFPGGGLQERNDNFMLYYAKWGSDFLDLLYQYSLTLEQEFCVVKEIE